MDLPMYSWMPETTGRRGRSWIEQFMDWWERRGYATGQYEVEVYDEALVFTGRWRVPRALPWIPLEVEQSGKIN